MRCVLKTVELLKLKVVKTYIIIITVMLNEAKISRPRPGP